MSTTQLEKCLIQVPLEITPELGRSHPEKVNLLFQAQLAGRSVTDLDSAFRLLIELARELVPCHGSALFWRDEPGAPLRVRVQSSFEGASHEAIRKTIEVATSLPPLPLLLVPGTMPGDMEQHLAELDVHSLLAVPLSAAHRTSGYLVVAREKEPPLGPREAQLLRLLALGFEPVIDDLGSEARSPRIAFLDRLTGVFNRRYFEQQLEREVARAKRSREPVAVLMAEVDDLDRVRKAHGPAVTDALMQAVVRRVEATCRRSDTLARWEAGRIAVLLPRTGKDQVAALARRLFEILEPPYLAELLEGEGIRASVCMGAATLPEHGETSEALLSTATEALRQARGLGGRRYYEPPVAAPSEEEEGLLDPSRVVLFREGGQDPASLLPLFARLCRETVPADRISVMVRDDGNLVIQEALGFEGRDQVVRTTRIPVTSDTISGWVARNRRPLLVPGDAEFEGLPANRAAGYRSDSFLSFPLLHGDELLGVIHFSNRSDGQTFTREDMDRFRPVGELIARYLALSRGFSRSQQEFLLESLCALVDLTERMVPGMEGHSRKVSELASAIARHLGHPAEFVERIETSSRLHDLGKAGYRIKVLREPRRFTAKERQETAYHPLLSWQFLETLGLRDVDRDAILYHHEREDGTGYMNRPGSAIPESAKIVAVADVYAALTAPRPYRGAFSPREALRILEEKEGNRFDPRVVSALKAVTEGTAAPN